MAMLRLGGLVSGIDTETLITQLMAVERRPLAMKQQQQLDLQAVRDLWKDIKNRVTALKDKAAALRANQTAFSSGKATSSDDSVIKATGGSGATPGVYRITVGNLAYAHSVTSDEVSKSDTLNISGKFKISMDVSDTETLTVEVTLDGTENISQIRSKIANATTSAGKKLPINATVVQVNDTESRLVLTANYTGARSEMKFEQVDGTPLDQLGIPTSMPGSPGGNTLQVAQDARVTINGITIDRSSNTFSDAVAGVKLELLEESADPVTITVTRDVDQAVKSVKALVDQYNSLAQFITEKSQYDSNLRKAGPLTGDSTANRILTRLRSNVLDPVYSLPSEWQQASQVGLSGTAFAKDDPAALRKLALDESKLRAALEENPQAVSDLFDAIAERLTGVIDDYTQSNGILTTRDKEFESQINRVEKQVEAMESRLELRERNLRRQFEALETALQQMRSQQSALLAQLSGLGGGNG